MTGARYLFAIAVLAAGGVGLALIGAAFRRRLLPQFTGRVAVLSDSTLALVAGTVVLQVVAVAHGLRPVVLALVAVAMLFGGLLTRRRLAPPMRLTDTPPGPAAAPSDSARVRLGRHLPLVVTAALVASLVAVWVVQTGLVVRAGVLDTDSLSYHLPDATVWASSHTVGPLVAVAPGTPVAYYPANDELLQAVGMSVFGRDVLGPLMNSAWLALLLLAAACLPRRAPGTALTAVCAATAIAGGPLLARFLPGGAMNDLAVLAALLSGVVLLLHALTRGVRLVPALFVAGAALGWACGAKLTPLPVAGTLTAGLFLYRRTRVRPACAWLGGLALPSLFWYARDVVLVGSPLPELRLPGLPSPRFSLFADNPQSVAHYAASGHVIRSVFVPQVGQVMGPAWPVLVALAVVGAGWALLRGDAGDRLVAAASVVAGVAYLVTPTTAGGPEGRPVLFAVDVRYALPALLLGLLAFARIRFPYRLGTAVVGLAAGATLAGRWHLTTTISQHRGVTAAAFVAAVVIGCLATARPRRLKVAGGRRRTLVVGLALGIAVAGIGFPVARSIVTDRWTTDRSPAAYRVARGLHGQRLGVTGSTDLQPFFGADLSDAAQLLTIGTPSGGLEAATTCQDILHIIRDARLQWLAVGPGDTPVLGWLTSGASAVPSTARGGTSDVLLHIDRLPDPSSCPR